VIRAGDDANLPDLPSDVGALRALLLQSRRERDGIAAERDALAAQNERLRHLLARLKRMQFGRKSERLPDEQLQFAFEEIEAAIAANDAAAEKHSAELRRRRAEQRRAGRGRLPPHLPRIEQVLEPEDTACPCCRGEMTVIGHDTSERLDVIPAQFRVLVTRRPKLACRACQGVVAQAPAPARLIEGGMPTEATVAQVLVSRYADHLPLYRQSQILARQGIAIGRDTLASWLGYAANEVRPVVARLREILLGSARLFADETTILSAKSDGLGQGGETRGARPSARLSIQPAHNPQYVHPGGDADLLQPGLCLPDVAAPAHREGTHALGDRALHSGSDMVTLLPSGVAHPRTRGLQRLVLRARVKVDEAARALSRCAEGPCGTGSTVVLAEHRLDAWAAVLISRRPPDR
jgi:transposase